MDAEGDAAVRGDATWLDPRWNYPEYPPGSVVEIRVHGVGGAPPEGMTRDTHPVRVGGSDLAGFWRARNPVVQSFGAPGNGSVHAREVLAWGGQTSGSWRHALWVLLLPFALFNVAGRMHPAGKRGAIYRSVARVMAYTITLSMTALTSGLAFDLLGAQYRPSSSDAPGGSVLLAPLRWLEQEPSARMAMLALLPMLVVLVVWFAGKSRTDELEGVDAQAVGAASEPVKLDASFWDNVWPASRLRAAHASGAFALVGAELAVILADLGPLHQEQLWWTVAAVASGAVVANAVVVALPSSVTPGPSGRLHTTQWILRVPALGLVSAMIAVATATHLESAPAWIRYFTERNGLAAVLGALFLARWCFFGARQPTDVGAKPDSRVGRNFYVVFGAALLAFDLAPNLTHDLAASMDRPLTGVAPAAFDWMGANVVGWLESMAPGLYLPAYLLLVPLIAAQLVLLVLLGGLGVRWSLPGRTNGVGWGAS
ncbi:MAG: hypothetical protein Q8K63_03495, partial [Acidimicrobiales bacterium]|nr:hypothetical protein [Acidimicrobiales bacterium]